MVRLRITLRWLLALICLALLCGCSKLTTENYQKLEVGLEYPAVVDILGKPDNCSEALFVRNCIWGDEQKNISVSFLNNQVILFTSSNIR